MITEQDQPAVRGLTWRDATVLNTVLSWLAPSAAPVAVIALQECSFELLQACQLHSGSWLIWRAGVGHKAAVRAIQAAGFKQGLQPAYWCPGVQIPRYMAMQCSCTTVASWWAGWQPSRLTGGLRAVQNSRFISTANLRSPAALGAWVTHLSIQPAGYEPAGAGKPLAVAIFERIAGPFAGAVSCATLGNG